MSLDRLLEATFLCGKECWQNPYLHGTRLQEFDSSLLLLRHSKDFKSLEDHGMGDSEG